MRTNRDEVVSTEVFVNAAYGYHVHAELVGRSGGRSHFGSTSRRRVSQACVCKVGRDASPLSAAWVTFSLSEAIQPTLSLLTQMRLHITEKAVFA